MLANAIVIITGFCDAVCTQMEVEAEAEDG